jgi:hypothetical protein
VCRGASVTVSRPEATSVSGGEWAAVLLRRGVSRGESTIGACCEVGTYLSTAVAKASVKGAKNGLAARRTSHSWAANPSAEERRKQLEQLEG